MRKRPSNTLMTAWAVLAGGLGLAAFVIAGWYSRGSWLAPLDDAYILLTYAARLAELHPFRFNPSDAPSTGSTSLLYPVLAAPLAAACGVHRAPLLAGTFAVNTALLWWAVLSFWRLSVQAMPRWFAAIASVAFLLHGPMVWGFFCGMETGLFIAVLLAAWERWARLPADRGAGWWRAPAWLAAALSLTRPEGGWFALLLAALAAWQFKSAGQGRRVRPALAIGAVALLLSFAAPVAISGSTLPSSGWAKSAWTSPVVPWPVAAERSARFFVDTIRGLWMGAYPATAEIGQAGSEAAGNEAVYAFPPGALLLFIAGTLPIGPARGVVLAGTAVWALGLVMVSAVVPAGWHHHRYLIPLYPAFVLLAFIGIYRVVEPLNPMWRRPMMTTLAAGWIAFSLPGVGRHLQWIGQGAEHYTAHHLAMAQHLNALPEPGAVAATDVGILRYFTGRSIVDLKGLTAPWLAPAALRGWGSIFDRFKALPPEERPVFAALHPGREDVDAERLLRAGVLDPVLAVPHVRLPVEFGLFRFRWPSAGGPPAVPGWSVVDRVDTGHAGSEAGHRYRCWMRSPEGVPYSSVQVRPGPASRDAVGDGGWVLTGGEAFRVNVPLERPWILMMRTYAPRAARLAVSVDGGTESAVPIGPNAARFQELLLVRVEPDGRGPSRRVRVVSALPGREYASYHYWVLAPSVP